MRKTFLVLCMLAVACSHSHTDDKKANLVIIGDSLMVNRGAESLYARLSPDHDVRVVASCSSRPKNWLASEAVFETNCGYWELGTAAPVKKPYLVAKDSPQATPKLKDLVAADTQPDIIFQQGTNMIWDLVGPDRKLKPDLAAPAKNISQEISSLLSEGFAHPTQNARCLWIAPPDTTAWSDDVEQAIFNVIASALADAKRATGIDCKIFDSRTVTHYPVAAGTRNEWGIVDGIHYDQTPLGAPEVEKWMRAVAAAYRNLR